MDTNRLLKQALQYKRKLRQYVQRMDKTDYQIKHNNVNNCGYNMYSGWKQTD